MNGLTEILIRFFDLLEAEGRQLQRNALRTVRMAVLLVLGLIFGAAAVAFLVAALYQALIVILHPAWVMCILALVCAGIAGGALCLSRPRKKTPHKKVSQ
ncbi:phage holin family protein [Desulfovibrio sp.]|uniref:phage holin family protein n=1 Tax=Desulfovibrio sp. TaxID=885 RepID=UPI0025C012C4|nr:phage holin family protein [Desulfovibrio sp.]